MQAEITILLFFYLYVNTETQPCVESSLQRRLEGNREGKLVVAVSRSADFVLHGVGWSAEECPNHAALPCRCQPPSLLSAVGNQKKTRPVTESNQVLLLA